MENLVMRTVGFCALVKNKWNQVRNYTIIEWFDLNAFLLPQSIYSLDDHQLHTELNISLIIKLMKTQNPHSEISLRWVVALACGFSCLTPWSIDCGPLFPVFLSISTFISVFMCILLYFSPLLCIWIWSIVQHICNNRREREGGRLTMQCNVILPLKVCNEMPWYCSIALYTIVQYHTILFYSVLKYKCITFHYKIQFNAAQCGGRPLTAGQHSIWMQMVSSGNEA